MSRPVLFVLGAGGNVGAALATRFAGEGYHVALAARSVSAGVRKEDGALLVKLDLTQPKTVDGAFEAVKKHFGRGPSVVVYNAGTVKFLPDGPGLDLSIDDFTQVLDVNLVSVFAAAKAALAHRPHGERLTFIETGNFFNSRPFLATTAPERIAKFVTQGVGKTGSAHLLEALGPAYAKNYDAHFFYADERDATGGAMWKGVTAEAHGEHYFSLVSAPVGTPVLQTFVNGKGYVKFE